MKRGRGGVWRGFGIKDEGERSRIKEDLLVLYLDEVKNKSAIIINLSNLHILGTSTIFLNIKFQITKFLKVV